MTLSQETAMPATVEIHRVFTVDTHSGSVLLTWHTPLRLTLVAKHTLPVYDSETDEVWLAIPFAQSSFTATLSPRRRLPPAVRVTHRQYDHYSADRRIPSRIQGSPREIALMERELTEWLQGWIISESPDRALASALAYHNAFSKLWDEYDAVDPSRLAAHQRRMALCAVRAANAADWMMKTNWREVREWALLHYVPVRGKDARSITAADLCLPR